MKNIIIGIALSLFVTSIHAQTEKEESIIFPESMQSDMDSLYWDWQSKYLITIDENCQSTPNNPVISDSIYIDRLSRIPSVIEMPFNDIVKKHIEAYTGRLRNKVSFMLAAANFYMPLFEEALDTYDLPMELKYLPIIESALNPTALSRQRASGLWQFMLRTGKIYGLENNSLVDERRDPIKSTWAAVRYLKDLYNIYKDWSLVLAAYNCGPGNVNKAIRRAGGNTDYWAIYPFLPRETRGYVPGFIAANYVMTYYCEHGICPMESQLPTTTDTIHINKDLHLQQVASVCNLDIDQLRSLNPQYKKDIIPGNSKVYALNLPNNTASLFIEREDSIYAFDAKKYLSKRRTVAVNEAKVSSVSNKNAKYHKIRRGDTLGGIARRYGVKVSQLRSLNGIRGNNITAGKTLRIR
ncbi:MAG: transglycosylase SLT domain-containing protein [Bacteroidaceae bacterium]|nr:transglycosylase SLT domain-containing protein [Bacteroidaceae bacterium]MBQ4055569.1 transglycosylase SLT domain-containing protein [Bacteroidaceae bacterium]